MGQATFPNGLFSGGRSTKLQCQMIDDDLARGREVGPGYEVAARTNLEMRTS